MILFSSLLIFSFVLGSGIFVVEESNKTSVDKLLNIQSNSPNVLEQESSIKQSLRKTFEEYDGLSYGQDIEIKKIKYSVKSFIEAKKAAWLLTNEADKTAQWEKIDYQKEKLYVDLLKKAITIQDVKNFLDQRANQQKQLWETARNDFLPYWTPIKEDSISIPYEERIEEFVKSIISFGIYFNIYFVGRDITWAQIINYHQSSVFDFRSSSNVVGGIVHGIHWIVERRIVEQFKSILLWNPLQSWLSTLTDLPNKVTIDEIEYDLSSLWRAKQTVAWKKLGEEAKDELIKLLDGNVTPAKLKVALAVEDKTLTNQDKDKFWSRLKAVFNKFGSVLPVNEVKIMNQDYDFEYFFDFRDRKTQDGRFVGSSLDVQWANRTLQKLFANKVTILEIETRLKELKEALEFLKDNNIFANRKILRVPNLLIRDQTYDVGSYWNWNPEIGFYSDTSLIREIINFKITITELKNALQEANTASKELWEDMKELVLWWTDSTTRFAFKYTTRDSLSIGINLSRFIAENDPNKKVTWNDVITDSWKPFWEYDFSETLHVVPNVVANQNSNEFRQFLLWNPLQSWLKSLSQLSTQPLQLNSKSYDLTVLFQERDETSWKKLSTGAKNVLKQLINDRTSPKQLAVALGVDVDNEKNSALAIGLATIGGGIFLVAVGGLIYWFLKIK